jgi:hypothetical protein
MLRNIAVIDEWKKSNWPKLAEWYGDFNLERLIQHCGGDIRNINLFTSDAENKVQ